METIKDKFDEMKDNFSQKIVNKKVALVLSGGGAKGIFQAYAIDLLVKEYGMKFDYVSGVSIGALNGLFVAAGREHDLKSIWDNVKESDFIKKRKNAKTVFDFLKFKIGLGKPPRSIYNNSGLIDFLNDEFEFIKDLKPFYAGRVDLKSGEYFSFVKNENEGNLIKKVVASTAIPVVFEPIEMDGKLLVDGGIRNISPIKEVINHNPDLIVLITTQPLNRLKEEEKINSFVSIAVRTLTIMLDEIFNNDIKECVKINDLVIQADEKGIKLKNGNGRILKHYDLIIIEPSVQLGGALDFDPDLMRFRAMNAVDQTRFSVTRFKHKNSR